MSLRKLPEIKSFSRPSSLVFETPTDVVSRFDAGIRAAEDNDATISIYDVIGEDFWTGEGTTAKRISAALRAIGDRDVTVNINSPGGDLFEGIAIYNILRAHPKKITVRIMAIAASAASIIAMAGDDVQIGAAGFLMIHNAWVIAMGNRHDLAEAADWLEPFDAAMANVYAARTGMDAKKIAKLMDDETWIDGKSAIDQGFADGLLPADLVKDNAKARAEAAPQQAVRRIDAILAKEGMSRAERRSLIADLKGGKPGAASLTKHDAGGITAADVQRVIATLKN